MKQHLLSGTAILTIGIATGAVISSNNQGGDPFSLAIWTGFQDMTNVPRPGTSVTADFNSDGFDDFAFVPNNEHPSALRVFVFWGNESGEFVSPTEQSISVSTTDSEADAIYHYDLNAGDINGDGAADIIIPTYGTQHYSGHYGAIVLLGNGTGSFTCVGDIDGDGETRVYDLMDLLEDWGCTSEAQ